MSSRKGAIGEALVYGLEDVPRPFPRAVVFGLQHVLTMFGATVAVPLLMAPAMKMSAAETATLVSACMLAAGLSTLCQVNFGSRLPIIQGTSFSFIGPMLAIIAATGATAASMQSIQGAILAGSVVEFVVGATGLIGMLRRVVTPVVIGPVIALIGLGLFEVGAPQAGQNWLLSGMFIVLTFAFALGGDRRRVTVFKLLPVLLAMTITYCIAMVLSLAGVFKPGMPGYVDFGAVISAPWFRFNLVFPWGPPKFNLAFFLAILAAYVSSMIESFGDYHSISSVVGLEDPSARTISRGIAAEGVGCFLAGLVGAFANTSYTENIGLVGLTRVASRYVVNVAAVLLIVLGVASKFGAIVATIPSPIVGGMYCTLFGLIAAVGLSNLMRADMTSQRNLMIVGFSMFMGLSLPVYLKASPVRIESAQWVADVINTVGQTRMAVAAIIGMVLDNLIPGTDQERGIA
ncbi:MAG: uracil-xanthine permease family protein [Bacillota bacterium]